MFNAVLKNRLLPFELLYDVETSLLATLCGYRAVLPQSLRLCRRLTKNASGIMKNSIFGKAKFTLNKIVNDYGQITTTSYNSMLNFYDFIIKKYDVSVSEDKEKFFVMLRVSQKKPLRIFQIKQINFQKRMKMFLCCLALKILTITQLGKK